MANDDNPRGLFAKLGEFLKRVFGGKKAEEVLPAEVPKNTEELRGLIIENERRGVNVNRAWHFYEAAKEKEEKEPEEVTKYVERSYNNLTREVYTRNLSATAFRYCLATSVATVVSLALWYLFRQTPYALHAHLVFWFALPVIIYFVWVSMTAWIKIARVKQRALELPEKVPKTTKDLRKLIVGYEKVGINVEPAWGLYEEARKFVKSGDRVKAAVHIDKAYGELGHAVAVYQASKSWFVVCVIALLTAFVMFYLMVKFRTFFEGEVILRVPLFIVAWGFIGSISYVLLSVYRKIRRQRFEWVDLAGYFYRIVLGGVLAAVSFYIIQLGITSLPGVAGAGVKTAVAGAGEAKEFRDAFLANEKTKAEEKKYRRLIDGFENLDKEEDKPERLGLFLKDNASGWEEYEPVLDGKKIDGEVIDDEYRDYIDKDKKYRRADETLEKYIWAIHAVLAEDKDIEGNLKNAAIISEYLNIDDLNGRANFLLDIPEPSSTPVQPLWEGKVKLPVPGEDEKKVITVADFMNKQLDYNSAKRDFELASLDITSIFGEVRDTALPLLKKNEISTAKIRRDQEENVRKWSPIFESVRLSEELRELTDEEETLEGDLEILKNVIWEAAHARDATKVDLFRDECQEKRDELAQKKLEIAALRGELRAALERDLARPVWEAPVFIVIAFLCGYSVEFVIRLFRRVEEVALREVPAKAEKVEPGEEKGARGSEREE